MGNNFYNVGSEDFVSLCLQRKRVRDCFLRSGASSTEASRLPIGSLTCKAGRPTLYPLDITKNYGIIATDLGKP